MIIHVEFPTFTVWRKNTLHGGIDYSYCIFYTCIIHEPNTHTCNLLKFIGKLKMIDWHDRCKDSRSVKKGSNMSRKGNLDIILKNMDSDRATKILAKSLYKELVSNGFTNKDIITFAKEMLDHMSSEMRKQAATESSGKRDRLLIG